MRARGLTAYYLLLSRALGLLLGCDLIDDLALFGAILGAVQAVVKGGEFDVRLQPVGIVFGQLL